MSTTLAWHDLQWLLRRAPKQLLELLKKSGGSMFVAGGFIRSCISGDPINDLDVFCGSRQQAEAAAEILVDGDRNRLWFSDNAVTVKGFGVPIQFIHRWTFSTPQECIQSFDFTIARAAFWFEHSAPEELQPYTGEWKSLCGDDFYADLAAKRLIYCQPVRNEDAGGSLLRVLKFYQRGYRIPLDSLAAVISRLVGGVNIRKVTENYRDKVDETQLAKVLTGLLREVDPNIDPSHVAHLPSQSEAVA